MRAKENLMWPFLACSCEVEQICASDFPSVEQEARDALRTSV